MDTSQEICDQAVKKNGTAVIETYLCTILAVKNLSNSEKQTWKNSGLYGIRTTDLCDISAALYQLS